MVSRTAPAGNHRFTPKEIEPLVERGTTQDMVQLAVAERYNRISNKKARGSSLKEGWLANAYSPSQLVVAQERQSDIWVVRLNKGEAAVAFWRVSPPTEKALDRPLEHIAFFDNDYSRRAAQTLSKLNFIIDEQTFTTKGVRGQGIASAFKKAVLDKYYKPDVALFGISGFASQHAFDTWDGDPKHFDASESNTASANMLWGMGYRPVGYTSNIKGRHAARYNTGVKPPEGDNAQPLVGIVWVKLPGEAPVPPEKRFDLAQAILSTPSRPSNHFIQQNPFRMRALNEAMGNGKSLFHGFRRPTSSDTDPEARERIYRDGLAANAGCKLWIDSPTADKAVLRELRAMGVDNPADWLARFRESK